MKIENVAALRNTLEHMETQQLDTMLLEELRKESPNGDLIRLIGSILKDRDKNIVPEIDANVRQAWERYQKKAQPVHKKPNVMNSLLLKAAYLILVLLTLMVLMPQEAKAMSFFERFIAWTENVFYLISPAEAAEHKEGYMFQTDNPGLQEVYNKVTELGITVPVVPMWFPEGYELVECKVTYTDVKTYVTAVFSNGSADVVYQLDIYTENVTYRYYKDGTEICVEEWNGIKHSIMHNKDLLVAVWAVENVECAISMDCQEDVLKRILESIYTMEDN